MLDEGFALDVIKEKITDIVQITPVGHHNLERHLVYKVERQNNEILIFKIFLKKNRWNREIATLKYLESKGIKIPRLLDYGTLDDGTQWSCIEFFDGKVFSEVKNISKENKIYLYRQLGEELAKIHNLSSFEYFGNWNEKQESLDKSKSYLKTFAKRVESIELNIVNSELKEKEILLEGIAQLKNQYSLVGNVSIPILCHNDFDERNILIKNEAGIWKLGVIIDFEQSLPWDKDYDLAYLYKRLEKQDSKYSKALIRGYTSIGKLESSFYEKLDFYMLFIGLGICSWSKSVAPKYFEEGLEMVKSNLKQKNKKG